MSSRRNFINKVALGSLGMTTLSAWSKDLKNKSVSISRTTVLKAFNHFDMESWVSG